MYSIPFTTVFISLKAEAYTELKYMWFIWQSEMGKDGELGKHGLELMIQWGVGAQSLLKPMEPWVMSHRATLPPMGSCNISPPMPVCCW